MSRPIGDWDPPLPVQLSPHRRVRVHPCLMPPNPYNLRLAGNATTEPHVPMPPEGCVSQLSPQQLATLLARATLLASLSALSPPPSPAVGLGNIHPRPRVTIPIVQQVSNLGPTPPMPPEDDWRVEPWMLRSTLGPSSAVGLGMPRVAIPKGINPSVPGMVTADEPVLSGSQIPLQPHAPTPAHFVDNPSTTSSPPCPVRETPLADVPPQGVTTTTTGADNATTLATDNATTLATDNATTLAIDNANTLAIDNATTLVTDNATTLATDNIATETAQATALDELMMCTVKKLRERLKEHGLSSFGPKRTLAARLAANTPY
jgi:hypothetical protein